VAGRVIVAQRAEHGIAHAVSCRALGASQAWFYKWRHGDGSPRHQRRKALAASIGCLFAKHKRTYGSPRITADLLAIGWRIDEHRRGADARAGLGGSP
jgi:putative transposase